MTLQWKEGQRGLLHADLGHPSLAILIEPVGRNIYRSFVFGTAVRGGLKDNIEEAKKSAEDYARKLLSKAINRIDQIDGVHI